MSEQEVALWAALLGVLIIQWLTARKLERIRETLRRHNIVHDEDKPWEGA